MLTNTNSGRNENILLNNLYIIYEVIKFHLKLSYCRVSLYNTHYKIMTNLIKQRVLPT